MYRELDKELDGPLALMIALSLYSFALLLGAHLVSVPRNGADILSREWWIIIIVCAAVIEVANQAAYRLGPVRRPVAMWIKATTFWVVFTAGTAAYICLLLGLETQGKVTVKLSQQIAHALGYLIVSCVFPPYSFCPDFRFLLLRGKFDPRG